MTQINAVEQSLDNGLLFVLKVALWHGRRALATEDLVQAKGVSFTPAAQVPATAQTAQGRRRRRGKSSQGLADDVATLGSKRVFDPKVLRDGANIKAAMERALEKFGTPFLSGWFVPNPKVDQVITELEELTNDGQAWKARLIANYDTTLKAYAAASGSWGPIILANAYPVSYVKDQIDFGWFPMRIGAGESDVMRDRLGNEVAGLLPSLLRDMSQAAQSVLTESLSGREKVTRKAFRPFLAMADKLEGFAFLDPRVFPVATVIREVIKSMPTDGPIEGNDLIKLASFAGMLQDGGRLLQIGEAMNAAGSASDVMDAMFADTYVVEPTGAGLDSPSASEEAGVPSGDPFLTIEAAPGQSADSLAAVADEDPFLASGLGLGTDQVRLDEEMFA